MGPVPTFFIYEKNKSGKKIPYEINQWITDVKPDDNFNSDLKKNLGDNWQKLKFLTAIMDFGVHFDFLRLLYFLNRMRYIYAKGYAAITICRMCMLYARTQASYGWQVPMRQIVKIIYRQRYWQLCTCILNNIKTKIARSEIITDIVIFITKQINIKKESILANKMK